MQTHFIIKKQRPNGPEVGTIGTMDGERFSRPQKDGFRMDTSMQDEYLQEIKVKKESKVADSRDELEEIEGYYTNGSSKIDNHSGGANDSNKSTRKTKEQVAAQLARSQLSQLRADTREKCDRKADWKNDLQIKYVIRYMNNLIYIEISYVFNAFLAFPTAEVRDEFLEKHRNLIMQAMPAHS